MHLSNFKNSSIKDSYGICRQHYFWAFWVGFHPEHDLNQSGQGIYNSTSTPITLKPESTRHIEFDSSFRLLWNFFGGNINLTPLTTNIISKRSLNYYLWRIETMNYQILSICALNKDLTIKNSCHVCYEWDTWHTFDPQILF